MSDEPRSVAEARERADHARERLLATFDDLLGAFKLLQQRLEPSHLARDAWEAAKSKGADMAEDAVDAVAKRPVATTGVIAAIALFLARKPLIDLAGKLVKGKPKPKPEKLKAERSTLRTSKPRKATAKKDETEIAA
ncbi:MAG TPA: hypothetical protein VKC17_07270 [Sphingomicrobium sp.]|nr:hypothetical protein [Sphingomicrobium sp.]